MTVTDLSLVDAVITGNVPCFFSFSFNGRNLTTTCTVDLDSPEPDEDDVGIFLGVLNDVILIGPFDLRKYFLFYDTYEEAVVTLIAPAMILRLFEYRYVGFAFSI